MGGSRRDGPALLVASHAAERTSAILRPEIPKCPDMICTAAREISELTFATTSSPFESTLLSSFYLSFITSKMPDIYNASQEDAVAPQEDAIPTASGQFERLHSTKANSSSPRPFLLLLPVGSSAAKRDAVEAGLTESEANKKRVSRLQFFLSSAITSQNQD